MGYSIWFYVIVEYTAKKKRDWYEHPRELA